MASGAGGVTTGGPRRGAFTLRELRAIRMFRLPRNCGNPSVLGVLRASMARGEGGRGAVAGPAQLPAGEQAPAETARATQEATGAARMSCL